jgi:hypothetical protein
MPWNRSSARNKAAVALALVGALQMPLAIANELHSGARMDRQALIDSAQDAKLEPGYAWSQPYCFRYHSQHPNLLILGDSIFDGWSGYLLRLFPRAVIDARVGRQFAGGIRQFRWLLQYPGIQRIKNIVVELGTNGAVTPQQVQQFMRLAGQREVVFVVPEVPRPWEREVQALYESLPETYSNVRLVYWNRISAPEGREIPADYWPGGVHPNWAGIQRLAEGLQAVLKSTEQRG